MATESKDKLQTIDPVWRFIAKAVLQAIHGQGIGAQIIFMLVDKAGKLRPAGFKLATGSRKKKSAVLQGNGIFAKMPVHFLQAPGRGDVIDDQVVHDYA